MSRSVTATVSSVSDQVPSHPATAGGIVLPREQWVVQEALCSALGELDSSSLQRYLIKIFVEQWLYLGV